MLLECLFPSVVVAANGAVRADAEQLAAQTEQRAVGIRIVDPEAPFGYGEVSIQLRQRTRQSGITERADGGLRLVAAEVTEGAGSDNIGEYLLPSRTAQQSGLVVITLGCEVSIAAGKIIQTTVLLECLIAEGAEGQVVGPIAVMLAAARLRKVSRAAIISFASASKLRTCSLARWKSVARWAISKWAAIKSR